jgi:hypothetical protein
MAEVKCDQCDEPRTSFIGPESRPIANFCDAHGRALTRANAERRGRIIKACQRGRARRHAEAGLCAYPTGCHNKRLRGLSFCRKHQPYPAR